MNKENRAKLKLALAQAHVEVIYNGTAVVSRRVYMQPYGKERPRTRRLPNGGTQPYMPPEYQWRRERLAELFGPVPMAGQPVILNVLAVRAMPASWSKAKKQQMAGTWCMSKPDSDNIVGAVMDALFGEDSNIVDSRCPKIWGWTDCLEITLTSALEVQPPLFRAGKMAGLAV